MAKIIILEGTDCVGKSYLIKDFLSKHPRYNYQNTKVIHFGTPEPDWDYWKVYTEPILNNTENYNLVFDRQFYSEIVYSRVLKRKENIDSILQKKFEDFMDKVSALVFFLIRDVDDLYDKYILKKEYIDGHPFDTLVKVQDEFIKVYKESSYKYKTLINLSNYPGNPLLTLIY